MARKRRAPGSGSVYKNKKDQWFLSLSVPGGKPKVARAKSEKDARAKLKHLISERDKGIDIINRPRTVKDLLTQWQKSFIEGTLKRKTEYFYDQMIRQYLIPGLGHIEVDKLQPQHLVTFLNDLRGRVSSTTVAHAHRVGRQAFHRAVEWRYVQYNVFTVVKAPHAVPAPKGYITMREGRKLLLAAADHQLYLIFLFVLTTGVRVGEVLGLRPCDFDRVNNTVSIEQQLQNVGYELHICTPKTLSSIRTLPLPQMVMDAFIAHCPDPTSKELIFRRTDGTPLHPRVLNYAYKKALVAAGLPVTLHFHHLRGSVATWLNDADIQESTISAVLGHSLKSANITRGYITATHDKKRGAIEHLHQLFMADVNTP